MYVLHTSDVLHYYSNVVITQYYCTIPIIVLLYTIIGTL